MCQEAMEVSARCQGRPATRDRDLCLGAGVPVASLEWGGGGAGPPRPEGASLTCVRVLQMNDNLLESWSDLDELKGARSLETVYLERNPLQRDPQYRRKVTLALPSVRQIDATFVRF